MKTALKSLALGSLILFMGGASAPQAVQRGFGDTRCQTACNRQTPYCKKLPLSSDISSGLSYLRSQLAAANTVPSAALLSHFGISNDPCERGDSALSNGLWRNKGSACVLRAQVEFVAGFDPLDLELSVPADLRVQVRTVGSSRIYSSTGEAVLLKIADPDLYNDWGGAIAEVTDTGSTLQFQMPRGCLAVELH